jgi:hypothetical protein
MLPEEVEELIDFIAINPKAGVVIPGTGGIRKLRWRRAGMGKRGGARVIYFYYDGSMPVLMFLAYAKGASEDITPQQRKRLTAIAREYVAGYRKRGQR